MNTIVKPSDIFNKLKELGQDDTSGSFSRDTTLGNMICAIIKNMDFLTSNRFKPKVVERNKSLIFPKVLEVLSLIALPLVSSDGIKADQPSEEDLLAREDQSSKDYSLTLYCCKQLDDAFSYAYGIKISDMKLVKLVTIALGLAESHLPDFVCERQDSVIKTSRGTIPINQYTLVSEIAGLFISKDEIKKLGNEDKQDKQVKQVKQVKQDKQVKQSQDEQPSQKESSSSSSSSSSSVRQRREIIIPCDNTTALVTKISSKEAMTKINDCLREVIDQTIKCKVTVYDVYDTYCGKAVSLSTLIIATLTHMKRLCDSECTPRPGMVEKNVNVMFPIIWSIIDPLVNEFIYDGELPSSELYTTYVQPINVDIPKQIFKRNLMTEVKLVQIMNLILIFVRSVCTKFPDFAEVFPENVFEEQDYSTPPRDDGKIEKYKQFCIVAQINSCFFAKKQDHQFVAVVE